MRRGRGFLLFAVAVALAAMPAVAVAQDDCLPADPTCGVTPPPPPPSTPRPTPKPTPKPTQAPTQAPATRRPVYVPPVSNTTPTDAPASPLEVGTPVPTAEVTVPGPAFNTLPSAPIDQVQNSASLTTWIFGFIAGFLIGALVGRASWGVSRRRRRQQIFG